jgi:hypothetical protein
VRAALVIGLVALACGVVGTRPSAAQAAPYTIEVSPSSGLADGDALTVTVRPTGGQPIRNGLVRICRDGTTYTSPNDLLPFTAGKCPNVGVSSSGSLLPFPVSAFADATAAVSTLRVGTGTVEWGPATNPRQFSLTCDAANPCRLVLDITVGTTRFIDASTLLSFDDLDPIGACGGADDDVLPSVGSDRLLGAWVSWTQAACASTGRRAMTQAVFTGEGDGHRAFHEGTADLAYSAFGSRYPDDPPAADHRPSVSVPVALNAAVVALLGGYSTDAPDWPSGVAHPYSTLRMTIEEMATLFGQGLSSFGRFLGPAQGRNAELVNGLSNSARPYPLAPAGSEGVSWLASRAFDELAGGAWQTAPFDIDGNPPGVPRGVDDAFALADPPFAVALFELYSAQTQLRRVAASLQPGTYGPIWILTDLATATELGLPTVSLQNASGQFVAPTQASLTAAASDLTRQADGTWLPSIEPDAPGAYPLTFVEHAVAPAAPLLDETCAARPGAQAVLAEWLEYLTGPGQGDLPPGLVGLTPALASAADEARARVGTAAVTGACGPAAPPTTPPTVPTGGFPPFTPNGLGGGFAGIPRSGIPGSGIPGAPGGPGDGRSGEGDSREDDPTELQPVVDIGDADAPSPVGVTMGILGLALLGALGGVVSRSSRPTT